MIRFISKVGSILVVGAAMQAHGQTLVGNGGPYGTGVIGQGMIGVSGQATSGSGMMPNIGGDFASTSYLTAYGVRASASQARSNIAIIASASGQIYNYGVVASASGGVGNYAGYFVGNVYMSTPPSIPSDGRLKRDIRGIGKALDRVLALSPSSYLFDTTRLKVRGLPVGRQMGFVAEEVKQAFPELVTDIPLLLDSAAMQNQGDSTAVRGARSPATFQSVNYVGLIPVLVGAIKEQQARIDALERALARRR